MTRIVAGTARGRRLSVPPRGTRPTSDRAREALFSILENAGVVRDCVVLDLFAGSGALGLEAASRGASRVVLVDMARSAIPVLKKNREQVPAARGRVDVVHNRAEKYLKLSGAVETNAGAAEKFDLVLLDPPYDLGEQELNDLLAALASGWLLPDAVVVVERDKKSPEPAWPRGWEARKPRKYGEARLWIVDVP